MRKLSRIALVTCLMVIVLPTSATAVADARTSEIMESYRWNKRPLLVFAPNLENKAVLDQRAALANAATEFRDRNMVLVEVLGDTVWIDQKQLDSTDADQLRGKYGIANMETVVLLIGKDGGVKLRREAAINPRDLYTLIDTMPMRQREMHDGGTSR